MRIWEPLVPVVTAWRSSPQLPWVTVEAGVRVRFKEPGVAGELAARLAV